MIERWIPKLKKDQCLPGLTLRMWTDKEGEYILYTDHLAVVAEKDAEIERLEAENDNMRKIFDGLMAILPPEYFVKEDGDATGDNS